MDSVTFLIDSNKRSSGTPENFLVEDFDIGTSFTPEMIKVLSAVIYPTSIPPSNVLYLCSDIIGGYSNGYYDIGYNIGSVIGGYCIIAVIPVKNVDEPTVYNASESQPYYTCLGTIFGQKYIDMTIPRSINFIVTDIDGNPVDLVSDWVCTIHCKQLNSFKN